MPSWKATFPTRHLPGGTPITADLTRPRPPTPTGFLPSVPSFTLTSADLTEQGRIPNIFAGIHDNAFPVLSWSGFPEWTQSFAVFCFDPDAPTMSGWWRWTIVDLDASIISLEWGAGASDLQLDSAAFHLAGDSGDRAWFGPYPPAGDGDHRYTFTVSALDVDTLDLDDDASPAMAAFTLAPRCITRAALIATYSVSGEPGAAALLRDGQ